jgi:hypothetical protein
MEVAAAIYGVRGREFERERRGEVEPRRRPSSAAALWWRSGIQQVQPREEPCEEA